MINILKKIVPVLVLSILLVLAVFAQTVTVLSLDSNLAEVNSDFIVSMDYKSSDTNDIIYIGLEQKESDEVGQPKLQKQLLTL
mgnify:CR=1 FL=1